MQKLNENRKYLQLLASETVRVNVPFFSLKYCWPGCLFTNVCRWTYIFKFIQWFLLDLIRLNCVPLFFLFHSTSEHRLKAVSRSFFALFFWNTPSSLSISQNPISQLVESVPHKRFFFLFVCVLFLGSFKRRSPSNCVKELFGWMFECTCYWFFLFCVRFLLITNRFKYITRALVLCLNVDM